MIRAFGLWRGCAVSKESAESEPPPICNGLVAAGTLAVITGTKLGRILTDGSGHVVYLFTKDTATASTCGGTGLAVWPPVIGTAKAGTGVGATKLGTIKRADGTMQATYGGHALYEHAKDATGAATGEGTNNNWFAVSPAGTQATEHDPHNHVRTTPAVHKRCRSGLAGIAGVDRLLMAG